MAIEVDGIVNVVEAGGSGEERARNVPEGVKVEVVEDYKEVIEGV